MVPETHACEAVSLCRIQLLTPVTDSIVAQSLGGAGKKKILFFTTCDDMAVKCCSWLDTGTGATAK